VDPRAGLDMCGKSGPRLISAKVKERVEPYLYTLLSAFVVSYWENGLFYK